MSAKVCFITAVLAATAFTLVSSCHTKPKSCKCDEVTILPYPYRPDCLDFFNIFNRFPSDLCIKIFEKKIPTVLQAYENYIACSEETARQAFIKLLNEYYSTCPESIDIDFGLIIELINATPQEFGLDDFPSCKIVYIPHKGIDLFDYIESFGSSLIVLDFFNSKGYFELVDKYTQWKNNVCDQTLKYIYRESLYDLYRDQKQKLLCDVDEFRQFYLNWRPPCIKDLGLPVPKSLTPPDCPDSNEIPPYQIVYTACGKDINDYFESFGSGELVAGFFSYKGYDELVKLYLRWKFNVVNEYLKTKYRECLYDIYRPKTPACIKEECKEFEVFVENWTPTSEFGFPLLRIPGYKNIISILQNYPLDKLLTFLNEKNLVDIIQPLTTFKNCEDEDAIVTFIQFINTYYASSPGNILRDYELLLEFLNGASTDSVSIEYGSYTGPRAIPTCGEDYLNIYDHLTIEQCVDFFNKKNMKDILSAYLQYTNSYSPADKQVFLTALTEYYNKCSSISTDFEELLEFINSWTPTDSGSFGDSIQIKETYTKTTTTTGDIGDIGVIVPNLPSGSIKPKPCGGISPPIIPKPPGCIPPVSLPKPCSGSPPPSLPKPCSGSPPPCIPKPRVC